MKELNNYRQIWSLSNIILLNQSSTSWVYKVEYEGQPAILKLLLGKGLEDERFGGITLEYFSGNGAVRILKHDSRAQLLEYIEGESLRTLVESGKDTEATVIIANTLRKLHTQVTPTPHLPTLRERFSSLFKNASLHSHSKSESLFVDGARVADVLLQEEKNQCVLHGDIHHENILFSKSRGWIAIDPKGLYGERTYDAANVFYNPTVFPEIRLNEERIFATARSLADLLTYDFNRLLAFGFVHGCLSASWSLEDGLDPLPALSIAKLIRCRLSWD